MFFTFLYVKWKGKLKMSSFTVSSIIASLKEKKKNLTIFQLEKEPNKECIDCKGSGIIELDDGSCIECPCTLEIII